MSLEYEKLRDPNSGRQDTFLAAVNHEITVREGLSKGDVEKKSESILGLFWELLIYRRGLPLSVGTNAEELHSGVGPVTPMTGIRYHTTGLTLAGIVHLPSSMDCTNQKERLEVWLHLANYSRNADPSDAIRNYYMIWEDMKTDPEMKRLRRTIDPRERKLRAKRMKELPWVRDFVSHPKIDRKAVAFLNGKLAAYGATVVAGARRVQYNPGDEAHKKFVREQREEARKFIEAEIESVLNARYSLPAPGAFAGAP